MHGTETAVSVPQECTSVKAISPASLSSSVWCHGWWSLTAVMVKMWLMARHFDPRHYARQFH
ncbi:hypothetical protein R0155_02255 [Pseudomonas monsensis]|nr:hypothetical protein [Pseudomonas monsensis]MDZ3825255.1 hypothetical protein [Pseudomonas monsensis]